jgi:hypothetical protein
VSHDHDDINLPEHTHEPQPTFRWNPNDVVRPIILRPTQRVTNDEFIEVCESTLGVPYPILVLQRHWEVI